MGITPADLLATDASTLARRATLNVRKYWRAYDWPEILLIEQRYYRDEYNGATTYAAGAEVYESTTDSYYSSAQSANTGHAVTDTAWWTPLTSFNRYVSLTQTGKTVIGEVLTATKYDPREESNPIPVYFTLSNDGAQFGEDAPHSVWLRFRKIAPKYTATVWDAALSYAAGTVVLFGTDGECYLCATATSAGQSPLTHAANWTIQLVPDFLQDMLTHKTYADWLIIDGQHEQARLEFATASEIFDQETDQLQNHQGQRRTYRVRTR